MIVRVTEEDIANGVKHSPTGCPVALAVKRSLKVRRGVVNVFVYSLSIGRRRVELPDMVSRAIVAFDTGSPVAPFTFALRLTKKL